METIRRQGRRFAWLMAGAAIGLAVVLLIVVLAVAAGVGTGDGTGSVLRGAGAMWLIGGSSVLLSALLGLVPGVRELEVTGAHGMLGTDGELLVPRRPRAGHHARTAVWVVLHLGAGLSCAVLLATFVPSAALFLVELASGGPLGTGLPLPEGLLGRLGAAALALLVGAASALVWWPLGAGLARLAPHLLGPTATDRLEVAEQRVAHEAERTRIARELHDGIGHALTVVSVQAAAARAVQHRDPEATATALAAIEETARDATGELDAVLALLREEVGSRGPDGGSSQLVAASQGETAGSDEGPDLETLLDEHRRAGMDLRRCGQFPIGLVPLARRHLVRGIGELLANAQRHGAPGPVVLVLSSDTERVWIQVTSPRTAEPAGHDDSAGLAGSTGAAALSAAPGGGRELVDSADRAVAQRGGRGLIGLRERAALLGGTLEAGPHGDSWVARLDLPLLREEER